jgi:hypothetical protein
MEEHFALLRAATPLSFVAAAAAAAAAAAVRHLSHTLPPLKTQTTQIVCILELWIPQNLGAVFHRGGEKI